MAKNGYKVFDSDTHVGPDQDIIDRYAGQAAKDKLKDWAEFRVKSSRGHTHYTRGARSYRRRLGLAKPEETMSKEYFAGFTGPDTTRKPGLNLDADVKARLADMDFEGVDVNFMLPSTMSSLFDSTPSKDLHL